MASRISKTICKTVPSTTKTMSDLDPAGLSSEDATAEDDDDFAAVAADIFKAFL